MFWFLETEDKEYVYITDLDDNTTEKVSEAEVRDIYWEMLNKYNWCNSIHRNTYVYSKELEIAVYLTDTMLYLLYRKCCVKATPRVRSYTMNVVSITMMSDNTLAVEVYYKVARNSIISLTYGSFRLSAGGIVAEESVDDIVPVVTNDYSLVQMQKDISLGR